MDQTCKGRAKDEDEDEHTLFGQGKVILIEQLSDPLSPLTTFPQTSWMEDSKTAPVYAHR